MKAVTFFPSPGLMAFAEVALNVLGVRGIRPRAEEPEVRSRKAAGNVRITPSNGGLERDQFTGDGP